MLKRLLMASAVVLSMSAQARQPVPLHNPAPITVPSGTVLLDVEKAIVTAALKRDWKVVEKKPGAFVLEYAARGFSAKVTVGYDTQNVTITYLDSSNLEYQNYSASNGLIHPNYNRWVDNLARDIESNLAISSVK